MNPILITELLRTSERERLHGVELARRARERAVPTTRTTRPTPKRTRRLTRLA